MSHPRCQDIHTRTTWFYGEKTYQCEKQAGHTRHHLVRLPEGAELRWPLR